MPDFAIIDPKAGYSDGKPTVSLEDVFLAKESRNVHYRYGRYDRMFGRLPMLTDGNAETEKIKTPTDVFAITSIVSGTKTINITGDHSAGVTPLQVGDTFRVNASTTATNNITFTVGSLPTTSSIVTVEPLTAQAASGNVFVGATPVIKYHRHVTKGSQTEYLLLGTQYHIFLWTQVDMSLTVKFTCGDEGGTPAQVERWEIIDHLRNVVATNNSDRVIWWNVDGSAGNDFEVLDEVDGINYQGDTKRLTRCKHLISYETYLILGYTTEDGDVYPQRERWASQATGGSTIDFDDQGAGDAGAKEFTNTPGVLMGFALHDNDRVISTSDAMYRSWLVTDDTVFGWESYNLKVGNLSADSLVNDKSGRLFWLASDLTIREIETPGPISMDVDLIVKGLNTSKAEFIQATYIDEYEETWFAIPSGSSETNNIVISLHPNSGRSFVYEFPIRAFGDFTQQQSVTYDTLPYNSYTDWGADWLIYDTNKNFVGFPLDLASDYLGNSFALHRSTNDDGQLFTGTMIISSTLTTPKSLNVYKRVNNGVDALFNRQNTGDATLSAKRDTEKSWQQLGVASFVDADLPETVIVHLPFDIRARTFQWRLRSTSVMEYIGFIFRGFDMDEDR